MDKLRAAHIHEHAHRLEDKLKIYEEAIRSALAATTITECKTFLAQAVKRSDEL